MNERHSLMTAGTLVLAAGLWGCGSGGSAAIPSAPSITAATQATAVSATATTEVLDAMERTLQDEYHAESIYLGVLAEFGDQRPFSNVVYAEQRHSESIARLYTNRGMSVPASRWSVDSVPHFGSVGEACAAAAVAERENVALYDGYQALGLPWDVANVFANNRAASLETHLPAFERCACQTCPAS